MPLEAERGRAETGAPAARGRPHHTPKGEPPGAASTAVHPARYLLLETDGGSPSAACMGAAPNCEMGVCRTASAPLRQRPWDHYMRARVVSVRAEDERQALRAAAMRLAAAPDDVLIEAEGKGTYRGRLVDADAEIGVSISEDAMEARVVAYAPPIGKGRPLAFETVRKQLRTQGVMIAPDPMGLERVLSGAEQGLSPIGIAIALGTRPWHGRDGRLELAPRDEGSPGEARRTSRPIHQCLDPVPCVKTGDTIGRIVPPEKGRPGCDIRGSAIPARDGRPAGLSVGRNVVFLEAGSDLLALTDGAVIVEDGAVSVTRTFVLGGDVDASSGNIRCPGADLVIDGTVRNGFKVSAGGDLRIGGSVENAVVEASGDVTIDGDIAMVQGGQVRSAGSLRARSARNACLDAEQDVLIGGDVSDCEVFARGRFAAPHGRVSGGAVRCVAGAEAREFGSPHGTTTQVTVGLESDTHAELLSEMDELEGSLCQIDTQLAGFGGKGSAVDVLRRTPPEQQERAAQLLYEAMVCRQRACDIRAMLDEQRELLRSSLPACISVSGTVHPGTTITIAGRILTVDSPIRNSTIRYDPDTDSIVATPA